jgi:predicted AlkP superfamily phosphohydrolase/phosphomutase
MGAYFKLYDYSTNPLTVALYATGVWYNPGYPRAWVNDLYRTIGPFPRLAPVNGVTNEADEINFKYRETRFFLDATLDVLRRDDWDFVITYQGMIDYTEHRYLLTDPRQAWYTDPISVTYWNHIRESYLAVDEVIAAISNTVGLTRTDILVASDHGQAPIHITLHINRLLAQAGLSVTTPISAYAQSGGGYAFVYINTTTRAGGVISPEGTVAYTATQDAIVTALENFTDIDRLTGEIVQPFYHVLRKQALGAHGLGIATAGDVFASVRPGYSLSSDVAAGPVTSPIAYGGTHGYAPDWLEMRGILLGAGPHIGPVASRPTRLIDVAPTIAQLLGLDPLSNADGSSLQLTRWRQFLPVIRHDAQSPD